MLFSSVYLFAFLFAANIHEHDGGYFYKDFNFKNSSSKFSKQSKINNADDCLSCHFAAASVLLPEACEVQFSEFHFSVTKIIQGNYQISKPSLLQNYLRGPPVFI